MTTDKKTTVIITGAGAGVGRAAALAYAAQGNPVGLVGRDMKRLKSTENQIRESGGTAAWASADVADYDELERAAEKLEAELGPVGIWVNNAMTTVFSPFMEITPEEFRRATEVTYLGTVFGTRIALNRMYPRNEGVIVQVGSALAYRSIPLQSPYCGAKHAIRGFTDSLRSELIHDRKNIHITMVQMPALNTPQFSWCRTRLPHHPQPVPPIYSPKVAAEAIVWASYHRRREWTVGLSSLKAILGNKFLPGYLDRMLAKSAYSGQQTEEKVEAGRASNLFKPVSGFDSAHGIFTEQERKQSRQFWWNRHLSFLLGLAVVLAAGVVIVLF